jgi:hypothetical protein
MGKALGSYIETLTRYPKFGSGNPEEGKRFRASGFDGSLYLNTVNTVA